MTIELEALTESELDDGMVWLRPVDDAAFPATTAGEQVAVRRDGDPLEYLGTVLDASDQQRLLVMLDQVAMTAQVYLATEEDRSPVGRPLVDPNAA